MKTKLLLFSLFGIILALAQTQSEINHDALQEYKKIDLKLNETYQEVLSIKKADTIFIKNLKKSQRIWIQYRDAQLTMKYPPKRETTYYKSVLPMLQASFLTELTLRRIDELEGLLDRPILVSNKNIWSGSWFGSGNKESLLTIQEKNDNSYVLHFKGTNVEWEGLGYELGNMLITIFRYKTNYEKGYFTITMNNSKRAEFSSYNSDGSFRSNGYLIKE